MTERLADISARIDGIRQLGAVVNAMRGIAAARARQARSQLIAVDSYAATIAVAIGRALALVPSPRPGAAPKSTRPALVLFCAEQGFAGAFSERVLDAVGADLATSELFLIGTRGGAVAAERGVAAGWKNAMPSHSLGVPKLADRIAEALYTRIATGEIDRLDAVFSEWQPGHGHPGGAPPPVSLRHVAVSPSDGRQRAAPEPDAGDASERAHRGLPARAALQRRAPRLRGGERSAHGGDGRRAQPDRAPAFRPAGDAAADTAGGDHGRDHRACRRRDCELVRPHPITSSSPEARAIAGGRECRPHPRRFSSRKSFCCSW